jgi:hypothetical protein
MKANSSPPSTRGNDRPSTTAPGPPPLVCRRFAPPPLQATSPPTDRSLTNWSARLLNAAESNSSIVSCMLL